jgi:hypothetical protein
MRFVSYNKEIHHVTGQLMDVFNNIRIKRTVTDSSGSRFSKRINVPCTYGTRSRLIRSLENRDKTLKPPQCSISMQGYSWDSARAHSVNEIENYKTGDSVDLAHNVATPIAITYELAIIVKRISDMEQIMTNFVAMMNPDIYTVIEVPQGSGDLKNHVIWDGSIDVVSPENISAKTPWRFVASTNFVIKTWIFPGEEPYDTGLDSRIDKINFCNIYDPDENGVIQENVLGRWYDNRSYRMSMERFMENVQDGLIEAPNYDDPKWLFTDISGTYWVDEVCAILSGEVVDFSTSANLTLLIENENSSALVVTTCREDGTFFTPEPITSADWSSIWRRMLSGDLTCYDSPSISG